MATPRVLLIGYGRVGRELESLLSKHKMKLGYVLHRDSAEGDVPWNEIDLAIDFSSPDQIVDRSALLFDKKIPLVQGTTGWDTVRDQVLTLAKRENSSLVWSYNFSLGMSLFKSIVSHAASLLSHVDDFDIALMEAHHRKKKDSPSGTLLSLQESISKSLPAKRRACSAKEHLTSPEEMDSASLRVGYVPGYHSVWIDGPQENIQLIHSVRSRQVFAEGALYAGALLLNNPGVWHFDELVRQSATTE